MKNTQETKLKRSVGRPSTITPEVIAKLEQAFAIDSNVQEALAYAEIKADAYYDYLKKNPEFAERIERLKLKPILKARQTIVQSLSNPRDAQWYLSKKRKNEFGEALDITTKGESIVQDSPLTEIIQIVDKELKKRELESGD